MFYFMIAMLVWAVGLAMMLVLLQGVYTDDDEDR